MVLVALLMDTTSAYTCMPSNSSGGNLCRLVATADVWLENGRNYNYNNFLIVGLIPQYPEKRSLPLVSKLYLHTCISTTGMPTKQVGRLNSKPPPPPPPPPPIPYLAYLVQATASLLLRAVRCASVCVDTTGVYRRTSISPAPCTSKPLIYA